LNKSPKHILPSSLLANNVSLTTDDLFTTNKFVSDFCLLGEAIGLTKELFAKKVGLSLHAIEDTQVIIAKHYIIKAYAVLLEYADDEFLGTGKRKLARGFVDIMVKAACTETTLAHAIETISRVIKIAQGALGAKLIITDKLVRWQFLPQLKESQFYSLIATLCACMIHKILSMLIKKEIPLTYIAIVEKQPDNVIDYQFLFACPLKFNQQYCEIAFDKSYLQQPVRCIYQDVKHYLKIPLSLTGYSHNTLGIARQIKDILAASTNAQFPDQSELAEQLGMSVRTMQRKLDLENSSYMQLKDDIRQRKAIFYLEHTNKHLDEIAQRCGFSEIASFTRAFTRWTGCLPSKYKL
jgi:AraC-like DNA-binding protein